MKHESCSTDSPPPLFFVFAFVIFIHKDNHKGRSFETRTLQNLDLPLFAFTVSSRCGTLNRINKLSAMLFMKYGLFERHSVVPFAAFHVINYQKRIYDLVTNIICKTNFVRWLSTGIYAIINLIKFLR